MLVRPTLRWQLLASYVEVNFMHPEVGPAGALALTHTTLDGSAMRRRAERLTAIPFRELAPYLRRWERGETVNVAVDDMPDELARRFAATPIHWSLNVPIRAEGTWVGLVGAVNDGRGFGGRVVAAFEALAEVLMREFTADSALCRFQRITPSGNRFLHLLR